MGDKQLSGGGTPGENIPEVSANLVTALTVLSILLSARDGLCANAEDVDGEELRAFVFKDNTGIWAKARGCLRAEVTDGGR